LFRVTAATAGATLLAITGAPAAPREAPQGPRIERKTLEEYIRFLASDELGGRANGTDGLEEAARYIADRFQRMQLRPAGDGVTYFQRFRVMTGREIGRHTGAVLRTSNGRRELHYPSDFEPLTFSASRELEAAVVFAGYGVTAPEHDYDDYASIQAQGRLVLLLRYAPAAFGEHGWHATFVRKAENALSHGARGVLVVNGPLSRRDDKLVPFGADTGSEALAIPVVHLRREHAEELLRASGRTLAELQKRIDSDLAPSSFELEGVSVSLTVDVRRTAVEVENVLGFLPPAGRDANPGLARSTEHIVIGAHYDHLGLGEKGSRDGRARGSVHNGADDNASGVAGVLELARLFSQLPDRPRGILFAAFAGEELGLKGSYHYTAHPTVPLENAVAMINLDMIGRLRHDRLYLGGLELFTGHEAVVEELLDAEGLSSSSRFTAEEASDHTPFSRAGVPALLVFTGLHGDYHKPTDDPQFINLEGMEQVLRFGFNLSDHLLRTDERSVSAGSAGLSEPGAAPRSSWEGAAYLGIGVDTSFVGEGVRFAYVAYDGPAARAGLEAGDVLLEIDGRAIRSSGRAAVIMRERRPGETVSAKVRRKDKILEVKVQLSRWP
jgi:hypothetical protein